MRAHLQCLRGGADGLQDVARAGGCAGGGERLLRAGQAARSLHHRPDGVDGALRVGRRAICTETKGNKLSSISW